METNVSIRERERRCEAKTPGLEQRPHAAKKPGLGIPQPGDKEESYILSPEIS
jgi:hypothetical protein